MDFSKLTNGQKIGLGSGVVMLVAMFLPWFGNSFVSIMGWDSGFLAWFGGILVLAGAVILALKAFDVTKLEVGTLKAEQIALLLSGLGLLLVILRWPTADAPTKFGMYIAIIAAAGTAFGVFMSMKEAGLDMPDADDFRSFGGGGSDS